MTTCIGLCVFTLAVLYVSMVINLATNLAVVVHNRQEVPDRVFREETLSNHAKLQVLFINLFSFPLFRDAVEGQYLLLCLVALLSWRV